jgi:hypothetical protein
MRIAGMSSDDTTFRAAQNGRPPDDRLRPAEHPAAAAGGGSPPEPPGSGAVPASLQSPGFRTRIRDLLDLHNQLARNRANPPMWGLVQAAFFVVAIVAAFGVNRAIAMGDPNNTMGGIAFIITFVIVLAGPDTLLYLNRRAQKTILRQSLEDAIGLTLRTYPDEVEHCGGVRVLADRVELEALIHVLTDKFQSVPPNPDSSSTSIKERRDLSR